MQMLQMMRLTLTWDVFKSLENDDFLAADTGLTLTWDVFKSVSYIR